MEGLSLSGRVVQPLPLPHSLPHGLPRWILSDLLGQGDQIVTSVLSGACVATLYLEKMS